MVITRYLSSLQDYTEYSGRLNGFHGCVEVRSTISIRRSLASGGKAGQNLQGFPLVIASSLDLCTHISDETNHTVISPCMVVSASPVKPVRDRKCKSF